jgi:hypothetical protein
VTYQQRHSVHSDVVSAFVQQIMFSAETMQEERTPLRRRSQEATVPKYLGGSSCNGAASASTQQSPTRPVKSWVRKLGRFSDFVLNNPPRTESGNEDDLPPSNGKLGTGFEEWLARSEAHAGDLPEESSPRREYGPRKRSGEKVGKMEDDLPNIWSDAGRRQSYGR